MTPSGGRRGADCHDHRGQHRRPEPATARPRCTSSEECRRFALANDPRGPGTSGSRSPATSLAWATVAALPPCLVARASSSTGTGRGADPCLPPARSSDHPCPSVPPCRCPATPRGTASPSDGCPDPNPPPSRRMRPNLPRWTAWCAGRRLDPRAARRAHIELWLRSVADSGPSRASVAAHYDQVASIYRLADDEELIGRTQEDRERWEWCRLHCPAPIPACRHEPATGRVGTAPWT